MLGIVIERMSDIPGMGMLGSVYIDGQFICYSMERNWDQNKRFTSCIPAGSYRLKPFNSDKYGETFALYNPLHNVEVSAKDCDSDDRYGILLHPANWSFELQGCISFGKDISWGAKAGKAQLMVTASHYTTNAILERIREADGDVIINLRYKHYRGDDGDYKNSN